MGRSPCCPSIGLNRGSWTASEDKILCDYINLHGEGKWRQLPLKAGLKRCGKSCRLRWLNYLKPDIKRGNISSDEEDLIIRLHKLLGNRWSLIAGKHFENYWNTTLAKKVHDLQLNNQNVSLLEEQNTKKRKYKECVNELSAIRTKAVRCSRTHFSPCPEQIEPPRSNVVVENQDHASPNYVSKVIEPDAFTFKDHENNNDNYDQSSFNLGVNMGGGCSLSGIFNLDFPDPLNLNDQMMKGDELISSSSTISATDATQGFSKEVLEYFTSIGGEWMP